MNIIRLRQSSFLGLIRQPSYFQGTTVFTRTYEQLKSLDQQQKLAKSLEQQLTNIQIKHEQLQEQTNNALSIQKEAIFTTRTPAKDILLMYMDQKQAGQVNHDLLANTLHQLAMVFASTPKNQPIYWDLNKYRLFQYSQFEVLLYDLNHMLTNDQISLPNLTYILKSLPMIQYYDESLLHLIYSSLQQALSPPKIKSLIEIPEFNQALSDILHKDNQLPENDKYQEVELSINKLKNEIRKSQQNVLHLIEAIENIQSQYFKFISIQSDKIVKENIELNFKMMQMEELLVEMGLISIEDVKDARVNLSQEQIKDRVVDTIWDYISRGSNQLENFFEHLFSIQFHDKHQKQPIQIDSYKDQYMGELILALSESANFVARNANDYKHENILNEDLLIPQERIFNFNYTKVLELAQSQLKYIKDEAGALGLAKLGLYDECRHVLNSIQIQNYPTYLEAAFISNFPIKNVDKIEQTISESILDNNELLASTLAILHQRLNDNTTMNTDLIEQIAQRFDNCSNELLYDIFLYLKVKKVQPEQQKQLQAIISQSVNRQQDNEFIKMIVSIFQKRSDTAYTKAIRNNLENLPLQLRPQIYFKNSAITILSTQYTSLNGEIDGRILLRQKLMQELFGKIQIKILPLIQLLDENFRLKKRSEFNSIIKSYFEFENFDVQLEIQKFLNSINLGNVEEKTLNDLSNLNLKFIIEKAKTWNKDAKEVLCDLDQKLTKFTSIPSPLSDLIKQLNDPEPNSHNNQWIGKTLGQSYATAEDTYDGFSVALLNQDFIIDQTYCPYKNENLQQLQKVTGHMLRQSKIFGDCQIHPRQNSIRAQITPDYLKEDSKQFLDLLKDHKYDQCLTGDYFLFNLLNMKAEIKKKFKVEDIAGQILSLDFWGKLFESRTDDQNQILLSRNGYEYLQQEQERNDRVQVQSQTLRFLYDQHQQKQALNEMFKIREEIMENLVNEAREKKISKQQLNEIRDKVDQKILEKIKDFKDQMKQLHTSEYFKSKQSYIDFQMSAEDIAKFEYKEDFDNLNDTDLYLCKGNADRLMLLKRSRAEDKMMLMYILHKTYKKESLTESEQQFLKSQDWRYDYKPQITNLNIADLSVKDKEFFQQFLFSNINEYQQFSLNELVLELSQFFDNSLFDEFTRRQTLKSMSQHYNLKPENYYKNVKRNTNKLLMSQKEQNIWNQQRQLTQSELEQLIEIIRIPKVIDFRTKEAQKEEVEKQKEAILKLNQLSYPLESIVQWVRAREKEIGENVDMDKVRESQDIWKMVFQKHYEESDEKELHNFVEQLVERMYLAKYYAPVFLRKLIKLILVHPNLSRMDYEVYSYLIIDQLLQLLGGYMDAFQVDMRFTSKDIFELKESQEDGQIQIKESLRNSEYPYFSKLWSDLNL